MRVICGYDNKHIINGQVYENIVYSEDRMESDAEVLKRVRGISSIMQ